MMHALSFLRTISVTAHRRRLLVGISLASSVLVLTAVSLALAATRFPDVTASDPYYTAISDLSSRGIVGGYANGDFGPDDAVTRQQFAKMIVLTAGYPVGAGAVCPFADVPLQMGADPLYPSKYVAIAAAHGITAGKTSTTFDPYSNISRYQVLSMVVRAADDLQPGLLTAPPDGWSGTGGWGTDATHGANATRAEYNGLLAGINLVVLSPYGNMTRGEVAQVLRNLLGKLGSAPSTTTTISTTTTTIPATTTTTIPAGGPIAAYSGSGDQVIDIQKPAGPALVWVSGNAASDYFGVESYGPGYDGPHTPLNLLVNTTDPYRGISLIDYWYVLGEEQTTRLVVTATGSWSIEIRPLSSAKSLGTPGQIQGASDDVILVDGSPDTAHIKGNANSRYFGVKAYYGRDELYDLLVNTTEPYDGTVMFSKPNAAVLEIRASGSWSIATSK